MLMPFRYLIRKQKQQGENMRYEQKAELQDSNKARMYEQKKKIYKCTRQDINGYKFISYGSTEDCYQLDTIEIKQINFDANNMESLCDQLNNNETGEVLDE